MLQNLTGWHAVLILAVVLLIFGSSKLPGLAKSVGQSMRILKSETSDPTASSGTTVSGATTSAQARTASSEPRDDAELALSSAVPVAVAVPERATS